MFNPPMPPEIEQRLNDDSLESCEALMVCLNNGRFVVVHPNEPQRALWPVGGGWNKVRQLKPGDEVVHNGTCTTVKAVEIYR